MKYRRADINPDRKTAPIHGISGCKTFLMKGTRPIRGKKMATHGEQHHLYNYQEEISGGTKTTIRRQCENISPQERALCLRMRYTN
jgi:hypothetical protein